MNALCKQVVMGLLLIICALRSTAGDNPFDAGRLSGATAGVKTGEGRMPTTDKRNGRLCGIKQDLDELRICVDGEWVSPSVFAAKARDRIVSTSQIGLRLSSGKYYQVGSDLPIWAAPKNERQDSK